MQSEFLQENNLTIQGYLGKLNDPLFNLGKLNWPIILPRKVKRPNILHRKAKQPINLHRKAKITHHSTYES